MVFKPVIRMIKVVMDSNRMVCLMFWDIYHLGPLERRSGHKSFGLFCFAAESCLL